MMNTKTESRARRLLTSELYMGQAHFNRRERTSKTRMRFRPAGEWIPITVPALISEAMFRAAQAQLAQNRDRQSGRPPARFYLLRGLVHCGTCGRKYVGIPSHGRSSTFTRAPITANRRSRTRVSIGSPF